MKKLLLSIFVAASFLSSCDMNEIEPGVIPSGNGIQTAVESEYFRNNLYSSLRAIMVGNYITDTELEMDKFVGLLGNGNRGMYLNTATVNSSSECTTDGYNGCYQVLKNVNFMISGSEGLLASGTLTADDAASVKRYLGETYFIRAYLYFYLFDHFCQPYSAARGDQPALGLSIVTTYDPTGDTSKYPGRSTQNEVKKLIFDDLSKAYDALAEFEQTNKTNCRPSAPYLSTYAVAAMQARAAMVFQDYALAITKANYVINSNLFALCTGEAYKNMWSQDAGSELLFVPFTDASEADYIGSLNDAWNYYATYPTRVDYIPTYAAYSAYDQDNDIRFESFFESLNITVSGNQYDVYAFTKFPGNTTLINGTDYYKNKPKPFRASEMYLILAEASAMDGATKNESNANTALNTLRAARITGYTNEANSGQGLINAIREERAKELIGEGLRMSDMRRWNLGFTRSNSYPDAPEVEDIIISSSATTSFSPGDYKYTWPIPAAEMQINPQLKGQQNPGY